jgi:hypothetical protein
MDHKPKLRIIKNPDAKSELAWRMSHLACAKNKVSCGQNETECIWWINSADHNFCFWRYLKDKSDSEGMMKELVQSELAALFGWSNTKTHFMLKQAIIELTEALKIHGAAELLKDLDSDELETIVAVEDYIDGQEESNE